VHGAIAPNIRRKDVRRVKFVVLALFVAALSAVASGCMEQDVNSTFDSLSCVYDGSRDGGLRLKQQVPPGQHIKTSHEDQVVSIPTSNRFFMVAEDSAIRDPRAPSAYIGYDKNNVAVLVQGQVRFRFNITKACEWYAKHGRRNATNGDLGFNARGSDQADTGWAKFLAENFGVTMGQVVQERTSDYSWTDLVYHRKIRGQDADLVYGNDLAKHFSEQITQNLGGQYFCGTEGGSTSSACPGIDFQVLKISPQNVSLIQSRVQKPQQDDLIQNAKSQVEILKLQEEKALIQARIDNAKCIVFAEHGLSCNGTRPPIIIGGTGQGG
jgi:hypothetical protein